MIYDTLNNLPNYLGMSDNLDVVIEFVMARDINNLPAGKTRIDGDKAVVTVSTVTPQTSDKALFQLFLIVYLATTARPLLFRNTHLLFRPAQTCPACQWLSLWESCHRR